MFVALIDTRPRWEPEPEPEPPKRRRPIRIPWRAVFILALVIGLFKFSSMLEGLASYGVFLTAVTVLSIGIERAMGYRAGLTEHRL